MITTILRTHHEVIRGLPFSFCAFLTLEHGVESGHFQITTDIARDPFCHVVYESGGSIEWAVSQVESVALNTHLRTHSIDLRWRKICRQYCSNSNCTTYNKENA